MVYISCRITDNVLTIIFVSWVNHTGFRQETSDQHGAKTSQMLGPGPVIVKPEEARIYNELHS